MRNVLLQKIANDMKIRCECDRCGRYLGQFFPAEINSTCGACLRRSESASQLRAAERAWASKGGE